MVPSLRNRNAHLTTIEGNGWVVASLAMLIADCGREDDANLGARIGGLGSSVTSYLSLSPARWWLES